MTSKLFWSKIFQWLFRAEMDEMKLRHIHQFKIKTLREIEEKKTAQMAVEAALKDSKAIDARIEKRFSKTYGRKDNDEPRT